MKNFQIVSEADPNLVIMQFGKVGADIFTMDFRLDKFTYDYVKLKIGYFSNRIPVWEGIFKLENLT